jgi:hypothetical protein
MDAWQTISPWRVLRFAVASLLVVTIGSAQAQPPAPSSPGNKDELVLTSQVEKDSYEIYSVLL